MQPSSNQTPNFKCGYVGIIGQPNAGKSSLMNSLVKEKVSIVTDKPQTTRRRILGIVSVDKADTQFAHPAQIIFIDAPGVLKATEGLNAFLTKEAEDVIEQSDVLMAVISVDTKDKEQAERIINMVNDSKKPWFVIVTKVDMTALQRRAQTVKDICSRFPNCMGVIEFSTAWREDAEMARTEILKLAMAKLPETQAPVYDVDLFTPHTMKEMVTEIVREQCFEVLHHEIPYNIAVRVQKFDETSHMPKIYAEILVARDSHKPIVVGKGGAIIKEIGMRARKSIEKMMDQKVFLSLEVSVRENWTDNKNIMKELGYVVE